MARNRNAHSHNTDTTDTGTATGIDITLEDLTHPADMGDGPDESIYGYGDDDVPADTPGRDPGNDATGAADTGTDTDATDDAATPSPVVDGPALISAFKTAVTAALTAPDTDRTAPAVGTAAMDAIKTAWSALRGRYRNDADGWLITAMTRAQADAGVKIGAGGLTATDPGRLTDSMILAAIRDTLAATVTRTVVDPIEGIRARANALAVAARLLTMPTFVDVVFGAKAHGDDLRKIVADATDYAATVKITPEIMSAIKSGADMPDGTDASIIAAVKIAKGRVSSARTGNHGTVVRTGATAAKSGLGVADHIALAFGDAPVGTFIKISQLAKIPTDAYPAPTGLNGRLSSRMFTDNGTGAPKTVTVAGRTFMGAMRDGVRGVVRTA